MVSRRRKMEKLFKKKPKLVLVNGGGCIGWYLRVVK
jgi:hypothetical protein